MATVHSDEKMADFLKIFPMFVFDNFFVSICLIHDLTILQATPVMPFALVRYIFYGPACAR